MNNENIPLEQKVYTFWTISKCFNGRLNARITTEQALEKTSSILSSSKPNSLIYKRVALLQNDIVHNSEERISA